MQAPKMSGKVVTKKRHLPMRGCGTWQAVAYERQLRSRLGEAVP